MHGCCQDFQGGSQDCFQGCHCCRQGFQSSGQDWDFGKGFQDFHHDFQSVHDYGQDYSSLCGPGWPSGLSSGFWQDFQDFSPD